MSTIRILGLDDDNHSPMFICENGDKYDDAQKLIEMLSKPHSNCYEIKMFSIAFEPMNELSNESSETICELFDILYLDLDNSTNMSFEQIFNMFWNSANRHFW